VTDGIHAYLAAGTAGLVSINVSDPVHPQESGSNASAPQAQDIVISGAFAYVADGSNGIRVFDIRIPTNPVLLSTFATNGATRQLWLSGKYVYVACGTSGLQIIDVSDPMNPRLAGSFAMAGGASNVGVWENHAYVANNATDALYVVDVSNPASPAERAVISTHYCYGDLGFSGHFMFVPNTFYGLTVYDISVPAVPVLIENHAELASANEVIVHENRVYVVNRDAGFYAFELASPLLKETFESSPVGAVPDGWYVENHGVEVAVSDARSHQGSRSVYLRASPYNGANVMKAVAGLGLISGKYRFSFYMSADSANWTGDDGYGIGHLWIQGYCYAMGIKKDAGVYKLCLYGVSEKTFNFPGSVDSWNKYDVVVDLDAHTADLYFNGAYIGNNSVGNWGGPDKIHLAAGASGPGGGYPTVYYDDVTIEKIR
jgi:hypothetical protein